MTTTQKPRLLHCYKCNLKFRQETPPWDDKFIERVKCSDCNDYIDTWDGDDGVVITSKGPLVNVLSQANEWELRQAELHAECLDGDAPEYLEEWFRP